MNEQWRDIPNFSRYMISNYGRVWNKVFERMMSASQTLEGTVKISLINNQNCRRTMGVAVMVAEAFVERPNPRCTEVILLDGNLANVTASNLAWRDRGAAYLYTKQMRAEQPPYYYTLPVRNNETGVVYNSVIEAGMTEGLIFRDLWKATYTKERVYPYGFTYQIVKRV